MTAEGPAPGRCLSQSFDGETKALRGLEAFLWFKSFSMVLIRANSRGQTPKEKELDVLGALPSGKALYWTLESQFQLTRRKKDSDRSSQGQASIPVQSDITKRLGAP